MLLEKFQRDHLKTCEEPSGRRTIVSAELPPVFLLRSLYAEIIRSLCADVSPTMRLHELETRAIGILQHAAPRMLLIDEIQHLLSCGIRDQRAALNAIKFLANKLRISIVAAGTHEALHVMRADPQIASRFEQLELPVWTESRVTPIHCGIPGTTADQALVCGNRQAVRGIPTRTLRRRDRSYH